MSEQTEITVNRVCAVCNKSTNPGVDNIEGCMSCQFCGEKTPEMHIECARFSFWVRDYGVCETCRCMCGADLQLAHYSDSDVVSEKVTVLRNMLEKTGQLDKRASRMLFNSVISIVFLRLVMLILITCITSISGQLLFALMFLIDSVLVLVALLLPFMQRPFRDLHHLREEIYRLYNGNDNKQVLKIHCLLTVAPFVALICVLTEQSLLVSVSLPVLYIGFLTYVHFEKIVTIRKTFNSVDRSVGAIYNEVNRLYFEALKKYEAAKSAHPKYSTERVKADIELRAIKALTIDKIPF